MDVHSIKARTQPAARVLEKNGCITKTQHINYEKSQAGRRLWFARCGLLRDCDLSLETQAYKFVNKSDKNNY